MGFDWQEYVKVNKRFLKPLDVPCLIGDYSTVEKKLVGDQKQSLTNSLRSWLKKRLIDGKNSLAEKDFHGMPQNYPTENRILTRALMIKL